jgi:hypothetical protein
MRSRPAGSISKEKLKMNRVSALWRFQSFSSETRKCSPLLANTNLILVMTRRWCCIFVLSLLIGAHRLPAPIIEEPQATPKPEQSATPKPRRTSKPRITNENSEAPKPQARFSTTPSKQTSRNTLRGTWIGSFGKDNRTIIVGAGNVSIDGGPMGREGGPIEATTPNSVTWTTRPMSLPVKWTLTVLDGGTMARVTTKHLLGGQSGSFQRKQ